MTALTPSPTTHSTSDSDSTPKRELFGVQIDAMRMSQAIDQILGWVAEPFFDCRYVVTPNVDHAVLLQHHDGLQQAYQDASLILADGHPVVLASRILGEPLPERVAGSDLVPALFDAYCGEEKLRVFLLGAASGVGVQAAMNIHWQWPNVEVVGVYSPPMGFESDADENELIAGRIALVKPDVLVVGLGAPKQECWVHAHRHQLDAKVALCVGATIDFLAGEKKRAPRWMQKSGVEWLHRMCSEPRRLVKRYAKDAWVFPQLILKQWLAKRPG